MQYLGVFSLLLGKDDTWAAGSGKFANSRTISPQEDRMNFLETKLKSAWAATQILNGESGIQAVMEGRDMLSAPEEISGETFGQIVALYKKLGADVVAALRREDVQVVIENGKAVVRAKPKLQFDHPGRRIWIAPEESGIKIVSPNRYFYLTQPTLRCSEVRDRLVDFSPKGTKFASVSEFTERIDSLKERVRQDELVRNVLNGPHFPICLPQIDGRDIGELVEGFVEIAGRSYKAFLKRAFTNHRKGTLAGQVTVVHESHKRLLERLTKGPLVGILTVPLQGFSIPAQREQMTGLPDFMSLAGLEFAIAMIAHPETLARDWKTPGLDLSTYQWWSAEYSLDFGAGGDRLAFDGGALSARGHCSGGVFLLG